MKKQSIIFSIILAVFFGFQSCDIDEKIIDEARGEDLLINADPLDLLAPAYNNMRRVYGHRWFFALQTFSADEGMLPTRGTDWFDGGVFQELHKHEYTPENRYTTETWGHITTGMAFAFQAISYLEEGTQEHAEAVGLLSHYMWVCLDAYGQVPYRGITEINFSTDPQILTGTEAVNTIIANLESVMSNLPTGKNTVRFNQDAAKSLMARVYLNKAVYEDRYASNFSFSAEDMQKVIDLTTEVISSGTHTLETDDYFSMFDPDNENHPEIIWSAKNELTSIRIGGRSVTRNTTNGLSRGLIYFANDGTTNLTGSDAGCTLPGFLDTWDAVNDPRYYKENYPNEAGTIQFSDYKMNRGFLEGQLYGINNDAGTPIFNGDGTIDIVAVQLWNKDETFANHTREVSLIAENQSVGVRVSKWSIDDIGTNRDDTGVDIVIFRLADLYLMRAEAKLRLGSGDALADVNAVRVARGGDSFAIGSAALEDVYNERGFEFYWEYHRRTDQIRFGTWEDTWTDKTDTDTNMRIFPIPSGPIAETPGLEQNPGF
ncbi:RagB/SusD family nutrient uptake outer membrane protein [Flavivirga aquimarina]|uniref:RagB/SusD family nutrient uptake outer membrane protein n=1 Tax=Flavivirga aquimarina TaxID=2027862 RepID=A0ABT8WC62_9FLAO|nr:RagB/SusD family nutrient uptake outer membrane protein [Flavivirga aquimarina]MDO5970729.1 RagB/SusD family nutrient uptake outer membrane protein [Flavivirga aquimarina]